MKSLDLDAVKAFVLTAELQSFTRAADALDSTQSASWSGRMSAPSPHLK
jgi:DNA-binding transcriptional LysR family regulator